MVKKFDAVIWNLYKHLWIFCCSAEYNYRYLIAKVIISAIADTID